MSPANKSTSPLDAGDLVANLDGHTDVHEIAAALAPSAPQKCPPTRSVADRVRVPRGSQPCRFYTTKPGCRAGGSCPYLHDPALLLSNPDAATSSPTASASKVEKGEQARDSRHVQGRQSRKYAAPVVDASRIVRRPVPIAQTENPRDFQLRQIRRRFSPEQKGDTVFILALKPSDPDFPYDVVALDCALTVPLGYPAEKPSIRVRNKEMDRGYQINVERGFDRILAERPQSTLLSLLNVLDRELESLLGASKAETIKLVSNSGKPPKSSATSELMPASSHVAPPKPAVSSPRVLVVRYSQEQRAAAAKVRERETLQLEARLGRLPLFAKSSDGLSYTVPIEPRNKNDLPVSLQALKSIKLHVPALYDIETCSAQLVGVEGEDAFNVEAAFATRALQTPHMSLLNLVNFLASDMREMAKSPPVTKKTQGLTEATLRDERGVTPGDRSKGKAVEGFATGKALASDMMATEVEDKAHIITIPRPPEWVMVGDDDSDGSCYDSYSYDSGDETEDYDENEHQEPTQETDGSKATSTAERGIMISFPFLELRGVELLELVLLNLTVKCNRCKEQQDVMALKNNDDGGSKGIRSVSCRKCANALGIGFRMDTMHTNSFRAGYLDLDGCTVVDLIASNFIPTCSECSTPYPAPGITAVRGDSSLAICRECHRKMTFKIIEVKFLQISASTLRASRAPPRKKRTEKLGIIAGTELPKKGRCKHYSKSYRWFRFSCCDKIFACDKCHDEETDHPNEHANRMICGFCSREQNDRPEDCGVCHTALTGKAGSGFWEGGKGTRDRVKMSRKDPRKYKRRAGGKAKD